VPAFILRKFAKDGKRLSVWRWSDGTIKPGKVDDLAIRNFYTTLNTDGEFDGRMEEQLGRVEAAARPVIDWLLSPLRGRALGIEERAAICQFIAFQMVRGPRKRKEIELMADYGWRTAADGTMSPRELRDTIALPHPNEHLRMMGGVSEAIFLSILPRPIQMITLDAPLLVICDEPVLVDIDDHVEHRPECFVSQAQLRRRQRRQPGHDGIFRQPIHIWPTKPSGVEKAEGIAMPVSPRALIVLGPKGQAPSPVMAFSGDEARELAGEVNKALVSQATEWVAAHPDHPRFTGWTFPPPAPLIRACDGGSVMSQQLQTAPVLKWQRIRKD